MTYNVIVTREDGNWLGEVPGLAGAHSYARTLPGLHAAMREVIALVEDLPEGAEGGLDVTWDYAQVDADAVEAAHLATQRAEVQRQGEQIAAQTRELVGQFVDKGWSSRDIAALLSLSPGRVSQIVAGSRSDAA
jgi:predicted RNase H-like HicB family nuclease